MKTKTETNLIHIRFLPFLLMIGPLYTFCILMSHEDFTIQQSVAAKASPYICGSKHCDLRLTETLLIAKADPRTLLNERSEIVSKCRHRKKFTSKRFR